MIKMIKKQQLSINLISESEFTVRGHGVHTAYVEMREGLKKESVVLKINDPKAKTDIIHIHTVGTFALRRILFSKKAKKVISAHIIPDSLVGSLKGANYWKPLAKLYLRWFYNQADLVLAVSDQTKSALIKMGVRKPIEVFYNSIDTKKYQPHQGDKTKYRKQLNFDFKKPLIISCGQIQPRKRFDLFVKMADQRPDYNFVWVGGMPFKNLSTKKAEMEQLIDQAPSNLTVTGVIDLELVSKYYLASDVFVLTSEQETFGLVAVEAAAANLPIVIRNIKDYQNTFADFALLANSDQDFVKLIDQLLNDQQKHQKQVKLSQQLAQKFDQKQATKNLIKLYNKLVD